MIQPPSPDEMRALAREQGLDLSDAELETYRNLMMGSLGALAVIDAAPSALPAAPADRRWWEPAPADNPHGAWFVRCEIRTRDDGPLAGLRFAVKDNVMVAGLPLLNGSPILEGYVGEADATVVTRLLDAGATLAGKAHCENLCLSGGSHTNVRGPVHNPRRRGHSAGGSSSGSAAVVAAGDVELAIGGDQGGSIRIPAALCGVVGMKPTWGLVPYTGIAPLDPSLDHAGPITANVRDNARMLTAIAGPDGIDVRQSGAPARDYERALEDGIDGMRIALVAEGFTAPGMQVPVASAVRAAAERLAKLGARVDEIRIPEHVQANGLVYPLLVQGMYRTVLSEGGQGSGRPDVYLPGFYDRMARWRAHAPGFPPLLKLMALSGAFLERRAGSRYYGLAANQARRLRACYDRALDGADALLLPTSPVVAPPLPGPGASIAEQFIRASETSPNTMPFDATHHPAISVPCGDVDGLPVGMMLVGRHFAEATLYRIAYAFEQS
ncbi:MAG TPA: amidase [Myxococcota bacterium]|nr:amidase [Myxococcota bacterium]